MSAERPLPDLGVELQQIKHQLTLANALAFYRTLDPNTTKGKHFHVLIEGLVGTYITAVASETYSEDE